VAPELVKNVVQDEQRSTAYWVGYWATRIGRRVTEIAIAYVLVSLAEGAFQTTVVCLLGLIYKRIRLLYLEKLVTDEFLGFLIARSAGFAKHQEDTYEQFQRSIAENTPRNTIDTKILTVEDWILNVVFVLPLVKLCLTRILG
jgi:hypothetical protein